MKAKKPSPAMLVALLALFVALGGTAYGVGNGAAGAGPAASASGAGLGKLTLRAGKIVDFDNTADDGNFNLATGHAECMRGERLLSGGLRLRHTGGVFPGQHVSLVDSGPVPRKRQWFVTLNSDLGGAARKAFVVFAYCRAR